MAEKRKESGNSEAQQRLFPEGIEIQEVAESGTPVQFIQDDTLNELNEVITKQREKQGIPEDITEREEWLKAERQRKGLSRERLPYWRQ